MSFGAGITLAVTLLAVLGMIAEIAPPDALLMGAVSILMLAGVVTPEDALGGFGSAAVLTVAALLVVAAGVRRTGVLSYVADYVLGPSAEREPLLRTMLPAGLLSVFINNTPIVAMFTPAVIDWCKRRNLSASRMLMPMCFAVSLGGMGSLIGTSSTVLVDGMTRERGMAGLSMFEISWVGIPAMLAGILIMWLLAPRVLPERRDPLSRLIAEQREYLVEMLVDAGSPMIGRTISEAGMRNLPGLFLMSIERQATFIGPVAPETRLVGGDRLVFTGVASTVVDLRRFPGLSPAPEAHYDPAATVRRNRVFAVVISQSSPLVGTTLKDVGFRRLYDAAVIAVHRAGERLPNKLGEVVLRPGDTLMIEAAGNFEERWGESRHFSLISRVRAEAPTVPHKARVALLIVTALVVAVSAGWLTTVVASFAAVGAMLLTRVMSVMDMRRAVDLQVLMVIAASVGISKALERSGAAAFVASYMVHAGGMLGAVGVLAAAFLAVTLVTQFVTNSATAALLFPLVVSTAHQAGLNARPFVIALAIAASSSFMTPIGYQTNLMIYGPGGYRFSDYLRLGVPVNVAVAIAALLIIPMVWPLGG